ncbi:MULTISPECIES: hypothetical protein [Myroides]|uniref:Uncharacterized protein n=1 Tax=Myroides phaeus TaxID=702745 RepID=A0A1G8EWL5_9FLAO|nr:hypothetical protein [Myroides phaeus]MEC4115617.1 hypothetical protein [Myroides phaeus]SDH74306.1 hypothetical protein SAMN05421818_1132 [Myroides phaeus]
MKALRIIPFFYLVIAALFIYDAIDKISKGENNFWLNFIIAGVAIFMFFFRRKFAKRMDNYNNK